ncbi:hypothetical protein NDU88_000704, partial [Pleurodeles waltl]
MNNPEWGKFIDEHNLCIFQETWALEPKYRIGYKSYWVPAIKTNSGRPSGGLLIWLSCSFKCRIEITDLG